MGSTVRQRLRGSCCRRAWPMQRHCRRRVQGAPLPPDPSASACSRATERRPRPAAARSNRALRRQQARRRRCDSRPWECRDGRRWLCRFEGRIRRTACAAGGYRRAPPDHHAGPRRQPCRRPRGRFLPLWANVPQASTPPGIRTVRPAARWRRVRQTHARVRSLPPGPAQALLWKNQA